MRLSTLGLGSLMLLFCFSCALRPPEKQKLQRKWMLVAMQGYTKQQLMQAGSFLDLSQNKEKNSPTIFLGCNKGSLQVEVSSKQRIRFSQLATTKMSCSALSLENQLAKNLLQTTHYSINGHFLTLTTQEQDSLKFVAADWD